MPLSLYKYYVRKFRSELTLEQTTKTQNDESSYQNLVTRDDLHGTVISKIGTRLQCGVT